MNIFIAPGERNWTQVIKLRKSFPCYVVQTYSYKMKGKDNRVLLSKIKYEIKYIKTSGPIAQVSKLKKTVKFCLVIVTDTYM